LNDNHRNSKKSVAEKALEKIRNYTTLFSEKV